MHSFLIMRICRFLWFLWKCWMGWVFYFKYFFLFFTEKTTSFVIEMNDKLLFGHYILKFSFFFNVKHLNDWTHSLSQIVPRKEVERGSRLTSGATGVTSEAVIKHLSSSHKIRCKRRVTSCRAQDDGLKKYVGSQIKPLDRDACKKKKNKETQAGNAAIQPSKSYLK